VVVGDARHRLCDGVAGAQLIGLQTPGQIDFRKGSADTVGAMPINNVNVGGTEFARTVEHMREQRPPGDGLQDLREVRVHTFTLAGGQDDDRYRQRLESSMGARRES
jgi:hypothetical protein